MIDYSHCEERWREVHEFANRAGLLDDLLRNLDYLETYANRPGCLYDRENGDDTRCRLYPDFAPLSFGFVIDCRRACEDWKQWFVGGLIYHGPHDGFGTGQAPTYSVSLVHKQGWQIHT
ncbi:DUF4120 family protein [Planctomicrobium sp. SH661]|uniref:DUF4120 family protein n=1 Tax=Planctomicrobium sp. SH661 TaxID=3448124 RepID=UPI003F5C4236